MEQRLEGKASGSRNSSLDFIRVMSMFFVIAVHTSPKPLSWSPTFLTAFQMLLLTCDSNFYMMSGELNLQKRFEGPKDYKDYYVNKGISILFPYLAVTFFLTLWSMVMDGNSFSFLSYGKRVYVDLMEKNGVTHMWFMYPLMGMLLSVPFLSKMLHSMKEYELHLMFGLGICWGIVRVYLTEDLGVGFGYSHWLLDSWLLTFFAGYYSSRVITQKNKRMWYYLGLACLAINLLASCLIPEHYKFSTDLAPAFVIFVMTFYVFLKNEVRITHPLSQKILLFLSKYSFVIYLIHYHVISYITLRIVEVQSPVVSFFSGIGVTFLVSLVLAVILHVCFLNPVQKWLRGVYTRSIR